MRHHEEDCDAAAATKKKRAREAPPDSDTDDDDELDSPRKEEAPKPKKKKRAAAAAATPHKRERSKSLNTVASRMKQVVDHMVASQKAGELHPTLTVFLYKSPQSEIMNAFFGEMQRENHALFHAREDLLALIATRYDEFVAGVASA